MYQYLIALNAFMNGDVQKANILLNQLIGNTKDTNVKLRALGTLLSVYAASNDWLSALQTVNIMNDHLDTDPSLKNNEINDNKKIF
ncbi:hypothetical protein [uncultured Paraglaciecola sp.]|uniref:hypothetical protein n=1 Tax=uncultured Paraglaciecola sp. TaxID=1765024 RepID=UPI0025FD1B7C|nr:hypothetical protein [uncultured Paraglaciecola sp.]